jgi:glyoxylase-like metal-dependent hydrolase (beta-lactamase superfamily II)
LSILTNISDGIERATLTLPFPPGHVHVYLLRGAGGWTAVDTGLGLPEAGAQWRAILEALDAPVRRIVITHFHPDHVGAAAEAEALTGASVHQGALDYAQCEQVWGSDDWPLRIANWMERHGTPSDVSRDVLQQGRLASLFIHHAVNPEPLRDGDALDGWRVLELPGHADGHLGFERNGVLIAGDHLLPDITPTVGRYADGTPDPLGAYLASLERTIELAPDLALPGHGEPITEPSSRARELIEHHRRRLAETRASLRDGAQTAYEVSLTLFERDLDPSGRRFAVAETLAHLERLEVRGAVTSSEEGGFVSWRLERPSEIA